jgi:gluconolactonase
VLAPGVLGPGRRFCRIAPSANPLYLGGDGATLDRAGNLYVATQRGVQIFDSAGCLRKIVRVPERPANVAFNLDESVLYITARRSVYALDMPGNRTEPRP